MIVTKTFFDKANTIIRDNPANTGLNPVLELNYGPMLSRGLIHFDHSKLKCLHADGVYPDLSKMKHILHMTNAASYNLNTMTECWPDSEYINDKQRATSFAIILFLIPEDWDCGYGFDYVMDLFLSNRRALSTEGSNWYHKQSNMPWETPGVYSTEKLSKEVDLFTSKKGNLSDIIIAYEKFDYGNENICIDITDTVNKFITGELPNYGIGIAFSPFYEEQKGIEKTQYVGFYTQHTHGYFEPYVQTIYEDRIKDDRNHFVLDTDNELYFYANVKGNFVNLDHIPKCHVNGREYTVEHVTRGTYRIKINLSSDEYESDTMLYDVWSDISYNGKSINDVEMQFVTLPSEYSLSFGMLPTSTENKHNQEYEPSIYGIFDHERILKGDVRKVNVECRVAYTSDTIFDTDGIDYRLYVDSDGKQIDSIGWTEVERDTQGAYFMLDTESLIPFRYHIDMRVRKGGTVKIYPNLATFDIVNDITDEKH